MENLKVTASMLLILLILLPISVARVPDQELDAAILALRSYGYTLFPNAIATSDLRLHLTCSNSTFSLFSPPDSFLFSLDLASTAHSYVRSLLRHVSPTLLSTSDLANLHSGTPIGTLIRNDSLLIQKFPDLANASILQNVLVGGIRISVPDLFIGSAIAVHGLEGIIPARFGSDSEAERTDYSDFAPYESSVSWTECNYSASSTLAAGTGSMAKYVGPVSVPRKRHSTHRRRRGGRRGSLNEL